MELPSAVAAGLPTSNASPAWTSVDPSPDYKWQYVILYLIPLATVWGNVFVCLAVYLERRLRHRFNLFLVSLAVSDLMSAVFIMPASAWRMITDDSSWNRLFCLIWHSLDILLTATTIIHLCSISLDRYLALRRPFERVRVRSDGQNSHLVLRIAMAWLIPFLIAGPLFIFAVRHQRDDLPTDDTWLKPNVTAKLPGNETNTSNNDAALLYTYSTPKSYKGCGPNDPVFVLTAILVTFVLPLSIMAITYVLTVRMLNSHMRQLKSMQLTGGKRSRGKAGKNIARLCQTGPALLLLANDRSIDRQHQEPKQQAPNASSGTTPTGHSDPDVRKTNDAGHPAVPMSPASTSNWPASDSVIRNTEAGRPPPPPANGIKSPQSTLQNRHRSTINRIHKGKRAVRVIGVLFLIFIVCYLPFFIVFLVDVFCATCKPWTERVMPHLEWLGYTGSMLNPVVYHSFNPIFRRTFRRLLFSSPCCLAHQ